MMPPRFQHRLPVVRAALPLVILASACAGPGAPPVDPKDVVELIGLIQISTGTVPSGAVVNHVSASAFSLPDNFTVTKGANFVQVAGGTQPTFVTLNAEPLLDTGSGSTVAVPFPALIVREPEEAVVGGALDVVYQLPGGSAAIWAMDVRFPANFGESGNTVPTPPGGFFTVSSPGTPGGLPPFELPTPGLPAPRSVSMTALRPLEVNPQQPLRFDTIADTSGPSSFVFKVEGTVDGVFNTIWFTAPADATGVTLAVEGLPSVVVDQTWNLTDVFPGTLTMLPTPLSGTAQPTVHPETLLFTRAPIKDANGFPTNISGPLVISRVVTGQVFNVEPIAAVFKQSEFSTYYTVRISNPARESLTVQWKVEGTQGASCYSISNKWLDGSATSEDATNEMIWSHPHPPCDPTTQHAADKVKVTVTGTSGAKVVCEYQGAETGKAAFGSCNPAN